MIHIAYPLIHWLAYYFHFTNLKQRFQPYFDWWYKMSMNFIYLWIDTAVTGVSKYHLLCSLILNDAKLNIETKSLSIYLYVSTCINSFMYIITSLPLIYVLTIFSWIKRLIIRETLVNFRWQYMVVSLVMYLKDKVHPDSR